MIEMKFYRDDEYVYINNPDGTTKRATIEDFESAISGEGGSSGGDILDVTVEVKVKSADNIEVLNRSVAIKDIVSAVRENKTVIVHLYAAGILNALLSQYQLDGNNCQFISANFTAVNNTLRIITVEYRINVTDNEDYVHIRQYSGIAYGND